MKTLAKTFLIAATAASVTYSASAQSNPFTNSTAFFNAISSSNYTETFASAPSGTFSGPTNFTGNGFTITANNTVPANGLFKDVIGTTNVLTLGGAAGTGGLVFNFSPNTYAVGGFFFVGNPFVQNTNINISLALNNAAPINLNTNVSSFSDAFFGWSFDTNQIVSLTVSSPSGAGWASASQLTVAVPEPSTYALLGLSAAALAVYVVRRRRLA